MPDFHDHSQVKNGKVQGEEKFWIFHGTRRETEA